MRAGLAAVASGILAVGTKELRGRMRGPRAFLGLTIYLAVLGGVALVVYTAQRDAMASQSAFGGGNPYVSAQVGQALFATQLLIQVLLVVFLAPAATSGAISLEREKQTLEMLTATPISTVGIVIGKLAAALAFVIILIVGSIPLTALVFLFGGVAPEDVLRGYLVLFATAIGFGCVGLVFSSLTRRTQTATLLTYVAVLALTVGTGSGLILEFALYGAPRTTQVVFREDLPPPDLPHGGTTETTETTGHAVPWPPDLLVLLNPVVAAADVICGTDVNPYSNACLTIAAATGTSPGTNAIEVPPVKGWGGAVEPGVVVQPVPPIAVDDVRGGALVADPTAATSGAPRDTFWPRSAAAWLALSLVLVLIAIQLVSPTRRWRLLRRRPRREAQP